MLVDLVSCLGHACNAHRHAFDCKQRNGSAGGARRIARPKRELAARRHLRPAAAPQERGLRVDARVPERLHAQRAAAGGRAGRRGPWGGRHRRAACVRGSFGGRRGWRLRHWQRRERRSRALYSGRRAAQWRRCHSTRHFRARQGRRRARGALGGACWPGARPAACAATSTWWQQRQRARSGRHTAGCRWHGGRLRRPVVAGRRACADGPCAAGGVQQGCGPRPDLHAAFSAACPCRWVVMHAAAHAVRVHAAARNVHAFSELTRTLRSMQGPGPAMG